MGKKQGGREQGAGSREQGAGEAGGIIEQVSLSSLLHVEFPIPNPQSPIPNP
ncbi:hypothetical protein [Nostoc sp. LEGE 12447]|uniref:hypothetical protein n=1 Tax=Nostoc sp. LEGE 12447 TaxID=1828640 RepID=UPI00188487E6|nr:hypothetical protein [Nostoc sp. LEGE 12447]